MNLTELIQHPERMDRETLYDLRSLIALHPYYQTARLLMLQNLYLLHDTTFDEELRRAAIYITDRRVLFQLIEAAHYKLRTQNLKRGTGSEDDKNAKAGGSRTSELIDNFLESLPEDEQVQKPKRRPTPADAAVDYVAYLLESGMEDAQGSDDTPQMKGQSLIDDFINREGGRIILPELEMETEPTEPKTEEPTVQIAEQETPEEGVYTEMMAQIYVRQGRYSQALEIIKRLNLDNPKKNAYFADQIRFLEKLIVNSKGKK